MRTFFAHWESSSHFLLPNLFLINSVHIHILMGDRSFKEHFELTITMILVWLFLQSSFLGRGSNHSLPSSQKKASSKVRSFIFGRDDSNSRSSISMSGLDDSNSRSSISMSEGSSDAVSSNREQCWSIYKFSCLLHFWYIFTLCPDLVSNLFYHKVIKKGILGGGLGELLLEMHWEYWGFLISGLVAID